MGIGDGMLSVPGSREMPTLARVGLKAGDATTALWRRRRLETEGTRLKCSLDLQTDLFLQVYLAFDRRH